MTADKEKIIRICQKYRERVLEIRHYLHTHPETGDQETGTTEYLCGVMKELGLRVERPLSTGLTAVLETDQQENARCVGLRADIDALPIREDCRLEFRSVNEGIMHACGHDIHMASLAGAAMVLSDPEIRKHLRAPVKFIFQPAEETDGGALRMIESGVLEAPSVDCMAAFHCEPSMRAGTVAVKSGYTRASSDMFDIRIRGRSAHGAYPEAGTDAIVAASAVVMAVQSIISRNISAFEPCVITIGIFQAGSAGNIVCDEAFLSGTMRTISPEVREISMQRLRALAEGVASSYGAQAEIRFRPGYMALLNHPEMTELLKDTAVGLLGDENVTVMDQAMMSVDDFSFFADKVPSVYFFAGSGYEGRENYGLHHGRFEADETMLDATVPLQVMFVLKMQGNGKERASKRMSGA